MNRAETINSRIKQLEQELATLEAFPEPKKDGTVVKWQFRYSPDAMWYSYAAMKIRGRWYITGRSSGTPTDWDEIVGSYLGASKTFVRKIRVATAWKKLGES